MIEPHLLNLIEQNNYKSILLWGCTPEQSVKLVAKATKALAPYTNKVVILICPSEPSEYTGYVGMRVQFLALPEIADEAFKLIDTLNF